MNAVIFLAGGSLTACGRCLRPALYSSLRSSPSHPTGVSALRVTIAIASARFARKQCGGFASQMPKSRRSEPATEENEEGKIKAPTAVRAHVVGWMEVCSDGHIPAAGAGLQMRSLFRHPSAIASRKIARERCR